MSMTFSLIHLSELRVTSNVFVFDFLQRKSLEGGPVSLGVNACFCCLTSATMAFPLPQWASLYKRLSAAFCLSPDLEWLQAEMDSDRVWRHWVHQSSLKQDLATWHRALQQVRVVPVSQTQPNWTSFSELGLDFPFLLPAVTGYVNSGQFSILKIECAFFHHRGIISPFLIFSSPLLLIFPFSLCLPLPPTLPPPCLVAPSPQSVCVSRTAPWGISWWRIRPKHCWSSMAPSPGFLRPSSSPPAPWTSPTSLLTTRTAPWSLAPGRTTKPKSTWCLLGQRSVLGHGWDG